MAIIHLAYTFDPVAFHADLAATAFDGARLDEAALLDLATTAITNASLSTRQALERLRYHEEWLDTSDGDISHSADWYIMALAHYLEPAPSLSNRSTVSYIVLDLVLSLAGWTQDARRLLIRGQWMHTLLESSGNPLFVKEFQGVDQYGGWLGISTIQTLLPHLIADVNYFRAPLHDGMESLVELASLWSQDPVDMASIAYADALDMLQTAISRNQPLFLILD